MFVDIFFSIVFILGVYYLIQYRISIKKAVDFSKEALYPQTEEEFRGILIPNEFKEMEPLSKSTRSYKIVKWGTTAIIIVLIGLLIVILTTDYLGSSFFHWHISFLHSLVQFATVETSFYYQKVLSFRADIFLIAESRNMKSSELSVGMICTGLKTD